MANRRTEQELMIQALKRAWLDHPELRLGQMIWGVTYRVNDREGDVFTVEDKDLLAGLRNHDCCRETTTKEGTT